VVGALSTHHAIESSAIVATGTARGRHGGGHRRREVAIAERSAEALRMPIRRRLAGGVAALDAGFVIESAGGTRTVQPPTSLKA
jgi:hypothetical protein